MATYTVSRKTWLRGIGSDESRLLRPDGMRCCLGFVGAQCGIPDAELMHFAAPLDQCAKFREAPVRWPRWIYGHAGQTSDCYAAMSINDADIPGTERESRLREIFAANGDEIIFTD